MIEHVAPGLTDNSMCRSALLCSGDLQRLRKYFHDLHEHFILAFRKLLLYQFHHCRPELAATVYSPATGRQLEVFTNSPGLQFYSGNQLTTLNVTGKGGVSYPKYGALVLETQIWY